MAQATALYLCYYAEAKFTDKGFEEGKPDVSPQSMNNANGAAILFARGAGNAGKTLYDAFNGFTQYYTSGDGCGKKADSATRFSRSEFGQPAEHKRGLYDLTAKLVESGELGRALEYGARVEANTLKGELAASIN